jgi:hypothetical protein
MATSWVAPPYLITAPSIEEQRLSRGFPGGYFFAANQASVTALSMMCRWILLHCGQVNVRKSWPSPLGSIAVNLIGEPQAVHWTLVLRVEHVLLLNLSLSLAS